MRALIEVRRRPCRAPGRVLVCLSLSVVPHSLLSSRAQEVPRAVARRDLSRLVKGWRARCGHRQVRERRRRPCARLGGYYK